MRCPFADGGALGCTGRKHRDEKCSLSMFGGSDRAPGIQQRRNGPIVRPNVDHRRYRVRVAFARQDFPAIVRWRPTSVQIPAAMRNHVGCRALSSIPEPPARSPGPLAESRGAAALKMNAKQAHDVAEASFKKKEAQLREGQKAMAEYHAGRLAVREKTARLRALRLTRDADEAAPTMPARSAKRG